MIISGVALIMDIGAISRMASCAAAYMAPAPTWLVQFPRITVVPSGAACAARTTPMLAPAPVTLSMITGWPSDTRMRSERMRASVSVGPPAGNGTMMVSGRDGKGSALAPQLTASAKAAATAAIFMFPPVVACKMTCAGAGTSSPGECWQRTLTDGEDNAARGNCVSPCNRGSSHDRRAHTLARANLSVLRPQPDGANLRQPARPP